MSRVDIPIGADARQLMATFKQIQAEIRRTGQEGKKFAEIDFTKGGLKEYAALLTRIRDNFLSTLTTSHRVLGTRINASGQGRALPWEMDFGQLYQSPRYAQYARQQFLNRILAGTPYQGALEQPTQQSGGRFSPMALAGVGMRNIALPLLAMAGIGSVASMTRQGFSSAQRVAETTEELYRRTRDSGITKAWEFLRDQVTNTGKTFGLTNEQTASLALEFAKTGNVLDRERVARESLDAAAFGMGLGIDPRASVQSFGKAAFMGLTGPGGMDPKQFALMIGETVARTGMGARAEQVMGDLLHYTEQLATQTARPATAADMEGFLGLRGAMYQQGALRGPLGDSLIQQMQNALVNPGMGEAGQFFMMRALGGQTGYDPAKTRYLRERGLFATGAAVGGPGGKTSLDLVMEQMAKESKGLPNKFWGLEMGANLFGMTMPQFEEWQKVWQTMGGTGKLGGTLNRLGLKPEDIAAGGIGEIGQIMTADERSLRGIAARYREKGDLKSQETALLDNARTTEQLRDALIKIAAARNLEPTPWREMQEEIADFKNKMEQLMRDLLPMVTQIMNHINAMVNFFSELRSKFANSTIGKMLGYEQTNAGAYGEQWGGGHGLGGGSTGQPTSKVFKRYSESAFKPSGMMADVQYSAYLAGIERQKGLPEGTLGALGQIESSGNPNAVNPGDDDTGIFQFIPKTGKAYGLATSEDRRDPWKSAHAAGDLARDSLAIYKRRIKNWESLSAEDKAVLLSAGHNADPNAVANAVGDILDWREDEAALRAIKEGRTWTHMENMRKAYRLRARQRRPRHLGDPGPALLPPDLRGVPEDLPPTAPPGAIQGQTQSAVGNLEILIRQQDGRGMPIGEDARHVMNLRTPKPFGRVDIDGINGAYGLA